MTLRDAGLIALGFLAGMLATSVSMMTMARDVEQTDKMFHMLRARWSDPRVQGQG